MKKVKCNVCGREFNRLGHLKIHLGAQMFWDKEHKEEEFKVRWLKSNSFNKLTTSKPPKQ